MLSSPSAHVVWFTFVDTVPWPPLAAIWEFASEDILGYERTCKDMQGYVRI
jgi:hypothetical protein